MRVFQSTYKDRNGKTQKTDRWYVQLQDHLGTCRRIPGFADRKATEALGRSIEKLVRFKVSGETLDQALTKWVEGLNPKLRENLSRIGLLDAGKVAALRPLMEHVDGAEDAPGWKQYLIAKGNTAKHVDLFTGRCRRAFKGCRATYWSELSATRLMAWLNEQRKDIVDDKGNLVKRGLGAHAVNGFVTALGGFAKWMQREGRTSDNPMLGLRKLNAKTDKRHPRRPYSVDEVKWLLDITRNGPDRHDMTGTERALLYRLAVETGFRANELRSLTRASFRLDGEHPGITVQAGYSKRRRDDLLPLRADTAAELREFLSTKLPGAKAFNMPEKSYDVVEKLLRPDLADARNTWLGDARTAEERAKREASSFLCYEDSAGRFADFHALRHTTGSWLAAAGVHPKVAQTIMRHSSIELTMNTYSHVLTGQEAAAVAALPSLDAVPARQQAKATGTDDATASGADNVTISAPASAVTGAGKMSDSVLAMRLAHQGGKPQIPANQNGLNATVATNAKTPVNIEENQRLQGVSATASEGNRTHNIRFTKAVLYH